MIQADNKADLTTLREELETSLDVAKRTEQRMRELDSTDSSSHDLQIEKPDS